MLALLERSAQRFIKNTLIKARRNQRVIVQGGCGTYDACGASFDSQGTVHKLSKTSKCCPLCAVLLAKNISLIEKDPEGKMAEILDTELDWVISFFQGWDGDEACNGHLSAYRIGKRLWREFAEDENG